MKIRCLFGFHKTDTVLLVGVYAFHKCDYCNYMLLDKYPMHNVYKMIIEEQPILAEKLGLHKN